MSTNFIKIFTTWNLHHLHIFSSTVWTVPSFSSYCHQPYKIWAWARGSVDSTCGFRRNQPGSILGVVLMICTNCTVWLNWSAIHLSRVAGNCLVLVSSKVPRRTLLSVNCLCVLSCSRSWLRMLAYILCISSGGLFQSKKNHIDKKKECFSAG